MKTDTADHVAEVVTRCLLRLYNSSLVRILNIIGVDETVALLRNDADALEANRDKLETARARGRAERPS